LGAGLVFIAIGVAGVYFGQDLTYGSSSRMGPGYFPIILSYLTIMMGLIIGGRGFALDGPPIQRIPLRPISFVILAILAFGFLIEQIGLALTTVAVIFIASAARKQFNVKETVVLALSSRRSASAFSSTDCRSRCGLGGEGNSPWMPFPIPPPALLPPPVSKTSASR